MLVLGIDTSTRVAGVALVEDNKIICERRILNQKTHSQKLMPALDEALKESGIELDAVNIIAVSQGPGSFTGLRIGVATAKTLAQVLGVPLFGVDTLHALAQNIFDEQEVFDEDKPPALVCPILDAQKDNVYAAIFRYNRDGLTIIETGAAMAVNVLIEHLKGLGEKIIFFGDGVNLWRETITQNMGQLACFGREDNLLPRAAKIAAIAMELDRKRVQPAGLLFQPAYLRLSEAERLWAERHDK